MGFGAGMNYPEKVGDGRVPDVGGAQFDFQD
jgi:hypothetical protein